jgi:hypothetical protein
MKFFLILILYLHINKFVNKFYVKHLSSSLYKYVDNESKCQKFDYVHDIENNSDLKFDFIYFKKYC